MSDNAIMSRFCRCGDLSKLRVKFHNLSREAKVRALESIRNGTEPGKAIKEAKH